LKTIQSFFKRHRKKLLSTTSIIISLFCLVYLGRSFYLSIGELYTIRDQLTIGPLLSTLPIILVTLLLAAVVWSNILEKLGAVIPLQDHFLIYFMTLAARRLPGSVLHVVGRVAWYNSLGVSKRITSFASVLEIFLVLWSGMALSLLIMLLTNILNTGWLILVIIGLGLLSIILYPRTLRLVLGKLMKVDIVSFNIKFGTLLVWLIGYTVQWLLGGTIIYLICRSLFPISANLYPVCLLAWSLAGVVGMIILILPSGFGINEATISLILGLYMPVSVAIIAAILARLLWTLMDLGVSALFSSIYGIKRRINP
jgi:uncharacterized membrane protein YbhN (UPF0104 family)